MINPEAGTVTVDSLTFLRDHSDPARFYYWNNKPGLMARSNGMADFGFTMFRAMSSGLTGGRLFLGLNIGAAPAALAAAQPALQKLAPEAAVPVIEPLPYLRGEIRMSQPVAAAAALVMGQEQAMLTADLTMESARLLHTILDASINSIGVAFHLVFLGSRPAPGCHIASDWTRVSHYLQDKLSSRTCKFEEIRSAVDGLVGTGALAISSDSSWGAPPPNGTEQVKHFLAEHLASSCFDFSYGPASADTPIFTMRTDGPPTSVSDADINGASAERHVFGQISLVELLAPTGKTVDDFVRQVDLDELVAQIHQVTILCPQLGEIVQSVEAELKYGQPDAVETRSVTLHSNNERSVVKWLHEARAGNSYSVSYRVKLSSTDIQSGSAEITFGPEQTTDTILLADFPTLHFDVHLLTVVGLRRVDVEVNYDDDLHGLHYRRTLSLGPQAQEHNWTWVVADSGQDAYWYETRYYMEDGRLITLPRQAGKGVLVLQPPDAAPH